MISRLVSFTIDTRPRKPRCERNRRMIWLPLYFVLLLLPAVCAWLRSLFN